MTLRFELKEVWDGWKWMRSPDNIYFVIHLPDGSLFELCASVLELTELYEHVTACESYEAMIGTGTDIVIRVKDGSVVLVIDDTYRDTTTFDHLEEALETLLRDAFEEMDRMGPADAKQRELQRYDQVRALYEQLSG